MPRNTSTPADSTNYCLLKSTWNLLCKSPFDDVVREFAERFEEALNQAIEEQGTMVTEETEVAKFLAGVNELIASDPSLIEDIDEETNKKTRIRPVIGKKTEEGLFLLPNETLAELKKSGVFTQKPSVDSLTKSLNAIGALIKSSDGKHLKVERRLNRIKVRGWLLSPKVVSLSPPSGDDRNDSIGADISTGSTVSI